MSRFIVVAPGSSEAAALATDDLARVLGVTTVDALAGTTATDAALRPASALPAAVEAVCAVIRINHLIQGDLVCVVVDVRHRPRA